MGRPLKEVDRTLRLGFPKYIADQRPDLHIVGIDLTEPQLTRASKLLRGFGDRVRFEVGDATQLGFPNGSFDGVIRPETLTGFSDR